MQSPDRTPVRPSALRNNSANPALLNKEDFDTLLAGINGSATNAFNSSSRTSDPNTTKSPRQYRSPEPSRMLIRRNNNQQLTTRPSSNAIAWPTAPVQSRPDAQATDHVTVDDRQTFARAEAKKKPVAPFVLKLWSFLDGEKYSDLIRWTENGTAFIVIDEDEFARTLIPEAYKHNNYNSFVRQLNMYGFHKRASLNAHSLKAAERKKRDPHVWKHKYFQKDREELLHLIERPTPGKSLANKRKRGHNPSDSEDEPVTAGLDELDTGQTDAQDLVTVPRAEVSMLREEVKRLQQQQHVISSMINQLTQQNEQVYQQASDVKHVHERHENSINAILTFLATFYNRSLEAGVNLNDMFGSIAQGQHQQHGTVVDESDNEGNESHRHVQTAQRRPLLLEDSPAVSKKFLGSADGQAATASASTPSRPLLLQNRNGQTSATSPALSDGSVKSPDLSQPPATTSNDMMSFINAANANTPPGDQSFDFSSVLDHAQHANGKGPLTQKQRNDVLNLIASQTQAGTNGQSSANNALVTPTPPQLPDLSQYFETQDRLNVLMQLQKEQDEKVQRLAGRLSPLSPSGVIPGVTDPYGDVGTGTGNAVGGSDANNFNQSPSGTDFDLDAFINSSGNDSDYFGLANGSFGPVDQPAPGLDAFNPAGFESGVTGSEFGYQGLDVNNVNLNTNKLGTAQGGGDIQNAETSIRSLNDQIFGGPVSSTQSAHASGLGASEYAGDRPLPR